MAQRNLPPLPKTDPAISRTKVLFEHQILSSTTTTPPDFFTTLGRFIEASSEIADVSLDLEPRPIEEMQETARGGCINVRGFS